MKRRFTVAALATAFAILGAAGANAAPLDEQGLRDQIIGRVLKGSMGFMTMRVIHRVDGTSSMRSAMRNSEGRWQIKGNKICVRWERFRQGKEMCQSLEALGNGQYRSSVRGMVIEVEQTP